MAADSDTVTTVMTIITVVVVVWFILTMIWFKKKTKMPSTNAGDVRNFINGCPKGFGYPYFLDGTGYAINAKDGKILLLAQGRTHIYERNKIRDVHYGMNQAEQWDIVGNMRRKAAGFKETIINTIENRAARKGAYDRSGIFLKIADVDTPEVQIKYSSERTMQRSVEILQQFMDGTLMD